MLGSLCEACYGLAIDCSHCNDSGLQPTVDQLEFGDCLVEPNNSPHPLVEDCASPEGHAERPLHFGYEEVLESYGAAPELSSDKSSNLVTLEQKGEIPAYRRHTKSKEQVKLLKDWFAGNPNPTGPQLSEYAKLASLEKDQVRNWFVNQRRPSRNPLSKKARKVEFKRKISSKGQPKQCITNSAIKPIPIVGRSHRSSLTDSLKSIPDAPESMLHRWRDSPPDEEPAKISAIRSAVCSSPKVDTAPRLDDKVPHRTVPKNNVPVLISDIPSSIKIEQFLQIMLLKDIQRPRTFQYEFGSGIFSGEAFAEFGSEKDALFAVSRLNHTLLEGQTLHADLDRSLYEESLQVSHFDERSDGSPTLEGQIPYAHLDRSLYEESSQVFHFDERSDGSPALESQTPYAEFDPILYLESLQVSHFDGRSNGSPAFDTSVLAEHFLTKKAYREETRSSWRSAASSNGSVASSAARSHTSSISFARRKYKNSYRRSDSQDQTTPYHDPLTTLLMQPQDQESTIGSNLLIHRPPTPLPPFEPDPEDLQRHHGGNGFVLGDMELCEEPEDILAVSIEDANIQLTLNRSQGTEVRLSQVTTKQSHSCHRYRCESCTHRFNTEEEWRTHETVVHRPREEWVCSLVPCMNPTWKDWKCAFCRSLFTSWEPFRLHRCRPCGIAPTSSVSKPVFNTRTGLADHVKHHHEGAVLTPFMVESWSRPPTWKEGIWSCGTCGSALQGWENRLDHLAGHFQVDILKTECSCFTSSSTNSDMVGDVCSENGTETSSPNLDQQKHPNPVNIPNEGPPVQRNSTGFLARARAWITRRVRRP